MVVFFSFDGSGFGVLMTGDDPLGMNEILLILSFEKYSDCRTAAGMFYF
jgi:hypothetical protein